MNPYTQRFITKIISWLMATALLLITTTPARADDLQHNVFLPLISQVDALQGSGSGMVGVPAFNSARHFNVDAHRGLTRLQHISENGGSLVGTELACGAKNQLEVYVIGSEIGGALTVQVTHTDRAGNQWQESRQIVDKHGVRFELHELATVEIVPNALHRRVRSAAMTVSTKLQQIPVARLMGSGYCHDAASCQQLVEADACHGSVSWNVVFTGRK